MFGFTSFKANRADAYAPAASCRAFVNTLAIVALTVAIFIMVPAICISVIIVGVAIILNVLRVEKKKSFVLKAAGAKASA